MAGDSGRSVLILDEPAVIADLTLDDAFQAVAGAFRELDAGSARVFPVVREVLGHRDAVFGIKSGFMPGAAALGLKAGGYWPGNAARGQSNHQSVVLLVDPDTGFPAAVVSANHLTAMRTAAATALSVQALARPEATSLGIVGAGAQALHQVRAVAQVLPLRRVLVWNRSPERVATLLGALGELGIDARPAPLEQVAGADVVVTVTPARQALVRESWVSPGAHIAAVGADTAGKIELEPALVARCTIYVDDERQARTIGECQHAVAAGLIPPATVLRPLGGLLNGRVPGRSSPTEVTLFDSTGIALQDLAVAQLLVARAQESGRGRRVAL